MGVLDIQRRSQPIGRLRFGVKVKTANGKDRPQKIETFRFTTPNPRIAHAIAELYGGQPRPWERGEWEVLTDQRAIGVTVPPRNQVVSIWYEMWQGGRCIRRCDSQREKLSGGECLCPHADDPTDLEAVEAAALERARLAKLIKPQACKIKMRVSVAIPDLPGLGVFRYDTSSFYAAGETLDKADLLEMARERGLMLPAEVRLETRYRSSAEGRTPYPVPVLDILNSFREIASGALAAGGITAQLPPALGEQPRALPAGAPPAEQAPAVPPPAARWREGLPPPKDAQAAADLAEQTNDPVLVDQLGRYARAKGWDQDQVIVDDALEDLRPFLEFRWNELRRRQQQQEGEDQ